MQIVALNLHHYLCVFSVSGDANFSMQHTGMTLGGFIQPSVVRSLIELQSNVEKGLCQRFLWLCPKATFVKFDQLQQIDECFSTAIGEFEAICPDCECLISYVYMDCCASRGSALQNV